MRREEGVQILVVGSITKLDERSRSQVLLAASHGSIYPAHLAAKAGSRGVILHDAGLGLDRAGIAGLDRLGMAAATISHRSARIGYGRDMAERGVVSDVNRTAALSGCASGDACRAAAARMSTAAPCNNDPPPYQGARVLLRHLPGGPAVWGLDSNSLVRPEGAATIVATGSHGALLGGKPDSGVRVSVLAAVYHDAGSGIDRAGTSRLPALAARGIIAATVAGEGARIGDARSVWTTGKLSALKWLAERCGARLGNAMAEFVAGVIDAGRKEGYERTLALANCRIGRMKGGRALAEMFKPGRRRAPGRRQGRMQSPRRGMNRSTTGANTR